MKANPSMLSLLVAVQMVANAELVAARNAPHASISWQRQINPSNAIAEENDYQAVLKQLLTDAPTSGSTDSAYVHSRIVAEAESSLAKMGEKILPDLISEMNNLEYIPDEYSGDPLSRLRKRLDPKWRKRIALARVIERISKQDFMIRSGSIAAFDDPDKPFNLINEWWKAKKH